MFSSTLDMYKKPLQKYYDDYTTNVSTSDMAISLEMATFLNFVISTRKPSSILDLGSGFSSFVFRKFSDTQTKIYSVDDNQEWLNKTKDYLTVNEIRNDKLFTWDEFKGESLDFKFDLIFHDLGNMKTRQKALDDVLSFFNESGVIIFDDIHKIDYYRAVEDFNLKNNLFFKSVQYLTLDGFGRYAGIAYKNIEQEGKIL